MNRAPVTYRALATVVSAFSLLMVTAVPIAYGARVYSPSLLLDWLGVVAVVWAATIAAETLQEMERARKAELTPALDIILQRDNDDGTPFLCLTLTNLGKGSAAGVKAWVVSAKPGAGFTDIERIGPVSPVIRHNESASFRLKTYWTAITLGQEEKCDLITHLRYRDSLGDDVVRRVGFAIGSISEDIRIVAPRPVTPLKVTECRHWGA